MPDALDNLRPDLSGFDASAYPDDVRGWGSDSPIFKEMIEQVRPRLIVEVGTWKGASALTMAQACDALDLDTRIVCVDTWLGAHEFIGVGGERDLLLRHGWPMVYFQFLANVVKANQTRRIIPFPQTSLIAARYLAQHQIKADLIYIDGSHDEVDVAMDIRAYLPLLRTGGVLFGDDYDCWEGVRQGIADTGRAVEVRGGRYWVMRND